MENHHFYWVTQLFQWPFSIANPVKMDDLGVPPCWIGPSSTSPPDPWSCGSSPCRALQNARGTRSSLGSWKPRSRFGKIYSMDLGKFQPETRVSDMVLPWNVRVSSFIFPANQQKYDLYGKAASLMIYLWNMVIFAEYDRLPKAIGICNIWLFCPVWFVHQLIMRKVKDLSKPTKMHGFLKTQVRITKGVCVFKTNNLPDNFSKSHQDSTLKKAT